MTTNGYVILIALAILCIISTGAFFWTAHLRVQEFVTNAKRIEAINEQTKHYVGNTFAAHVLRAAAEDLDSTEGRTTIRRIQASEFKIGGPSVGNLWLHDRADSIAPRFDDSEIVERNMDGSPA